MSKNYRLTNRDGVYYYRRRVPVEAVSSIGKKIIQVSLKTKDWNEAAKLRTFMDLEWDAKFEHAVEGLINSAPIKTTLSRSEALRIIREDLEAADKKHQTMEANNEGITKEQIRDIRIENETFIQWLEDPSHPETDRLVGTDGQRLLREHGIELSSSTEERAVYFEFVRRALLEFYRRAAARSRQEYSRPSLPTSLRHRPRLELL